MAQFSKEGSEIVGVGLFRQVDRKAILDRWFVHDDPADPVYVELDHYSDQKQCYTAMVDVHREDQPIPLRLELLRRFIEWIPVSRELCPFVLSHPRL